MWKSLIILGKIVPSAHVPRACLRFFSIICYEINKVSSDKEQNGF